VDHNIIIHPKPFRKMKKEELHRNIMQAVELIEDGSPRQAKELLVELANRITFT